MRTAIAFAFSLIAVSLSAAPSYSVLDIGTVPFGGSVAALAINNHGQITGQVNVSGSWRLFTYSAGTMQDLGTLPGYGHAYGTAINNYGHIVGQAWDGADAFRAFYYDSISGMVDLGSLGGGYSQAFDINDSSQTVGLAKDSGGTVRGFLITVGNSMTDIGTLGGNSAFAKGLNNPGDIVGTSLTSDDKSRAFLLPAGSSMTNLGSLSANGANDGVAINDSGQITGYAETVGGTRGFLISANTMNHIGTLGGSDSYPYAINASGVVVGSAQDSSGNHRAFVYIDGGILNLNDLVTVSTILSQARGINDSGQIIANGENGHAYLLTPTSVPEPSVACMASIGLIAVVWFRLRRET